MATGTTEDKSFDLSTLVFTVFIFISALLTLKLIVQLFSILKLRLKNESEKAASFRVVKLNDNKISPFSFFYWIFVNAGNHNFQKLDEIIAHEQVHVRQFHSFDVMISEILCICFWWNPFTWFLRKEMKINLEYLADEGVLKAGFQPKGYQYTLLQVSSKNMDMSLINNFNVSQLKKRIVMMNKKKSSILMSAKYVLTVPIISFLLLGNAVQAAPDFLNFESNNKLIIADTHQKPQKTTAKSKTADVPLKKGDTYVTVEKMPAYPGGETEMFKFIQENLKYPVEAQNKGLEGRVTLRFVVKKTGELSDVTLIRGVDPELDAEAIRVVRAMPKWIPGKYKGEDVDVYFTLPIVYRLKGDSKQAQNDYSSLKNLNVLIVLDGKVLTKEEMKDVLAEDVAEVKVLKGDAAEKKYGDLAKGKDGVIEITSKK